MSHRQAELQTFVLDALMRSASLIEAEGRGRLRFSLGRGDSAAFAATTAVGSSLHVVTDSRMTSPVVSFPHPDPLPEGERTLVHAAVHDCWLHLSARPSSGPVGQPRVFETTALLRRNAELTGGVKFAWVAADPDLRLQAEVPLDDGEAQARRRIAEACAGFAGAASTAGASRDGVAISAPDPADLRTAVAESGWSVRERPDGPLTVDLDVPDVFLQASVDAQDGVTRFAVELAAVEAAPSACREALALLLLRVSGAVRMARAVLPPASGAPRLEVVLAGAPTAAEAGHALSALAVACRHCAREVEVVQRDETIAGMYLRAPASGSNQTPAVQAGEGG